MNKIYRLKFSKRLNALVAVSELTRGCDHSTEKGSEKTCSYESTPLGVKATFRYIAIFGHGIHSAICFSERFTGNERRTRYSNHASRRQ